MGDVAIRVEGVGKRYRIGEAQRPAYGTLRDALTSFAGRQLERLRHPFRSRRSDTSTIWALKDVSFEVKRGEVVGIIGRNGAGKSTLLKILARITEPTEGRVVLHGRVGSLLEVGTGFHLELTGRENIYLNGAILGMRKAEIDRKFDEIVAFAEVDKFIDTPVKHYSSGMHVRLAFAVAAHLEPEILLVDEVLAVGDAAFQKKCLGKMGEVARAGRTVLFVSHNMGAIQALCSRAAWVGNGRLVQSGPVAEVVLRYLESTVPPDRVSSVTDLPRVTGGDLVRLSALEAIDSDGRPTRLLQSGRPVVFRFVVRKLLESCPPFAIEWTAVSSDGQRAMYVSSSPQQGLVFTPGSDETVIDCRIAALPLTAGTYSVHTLLSVPHRQRLDEVEDAASFEVAACDLYGTGFTVTQRHGACTVPSTWELKGDNTRWIS